MFDEEDSSAAHDVDPELHKVHRKPKGALKDFRAKQGDLNRRHRGLMQWGAARKMAWIGHGVEENAKKVGERLMFKHHEKGPGIEKEV